MNQSLIDSSSVIVDVTIRQIVQLHNLPDRFSSPNHSSDYLMPFGVNICELLLSACLRPLAYEADLLSASLSQHAQAQWCESGNHWQAHLLKACWKR
jgi:hypothetical protein